MVVSGHNGVRRVAYAPPAGEALPVEVTTYRDIISRKGVEFFSRPDRPEFELVILVESDSGHHTIDFQKVALRRGRLLRIRSGQVQSWDTIADVEAKVVLAAEPSPGTPSHLPNRPSCDLSPESMVIAETIVRALEIEQARFDDSYAAGRLIRYLFATLDALFDRSSPSPNRKSHAAYHAFVSSIDSNVGASHNVRDYAQSLGYSERTITRACKQATGLTAKEVLAQRLILEAKRLLAHTDLRVASIASHLGFNEATNFNKFFTRNTKQRPGDFRSTHRFDQGGS